MSGDGRAIERSLAQEPFASATLRTLDGTRRIQLRWRPGVVTRCDKPHSVRTFRRLENLFSLCILAYVFATDHLRRVPGFRKVLKLFSDNLETKYPAPPPDLLAGIRALVAVPIVRFISGRPRKVHPPNPLQLLLAL